jgi:hypothetical protein
MLCRKCGAENDDKEYFCAQCGAALEEDSPADRPPGAEDVPDAAAGTAIDFDALPGGTEKESPSDRPVYDEEIPTYLVQAILVTLFCCMPFGVVAIVFAAMANGHLTAGNKTAAVAASDKAKTWCLAAFWCGLVWAIFVFFVFAMQGGRHF